MAFYILLGRRLVGIEEVVEQLVHVAALLAMRCLST
jgi:hypothetical protein